MKRLLPLLLTLTFSIWACRPTPQPELDQEEGDAGHPGWFQQWMDMKADAQGQIPEGVWGRVAERVIQADGSRKTQSTILSNIQEIGPDNIGGRTRALIQDLLNANRWLAGGISGGIWESTDSGQNWHPVDDAAPQFSVMSLAQDPNLPLNIYYCTGEPRGNSAGVIGAGVWKSTDGGQTFAQLPSTNNGIFDEAWKVAIDPTIPDLVYIATHDDGLYRSSDGGATFSPVLITGTPCDVTDVEVFPDGSVMAGIRTDGVYYSPTGAAGTWNELTGNLPTSGFRRVELAYCDSFPNIVYVQYEDDNGSDLLNIYKTTDGGNNWATVTNPNVNPGVTYAFPWYAFLLTVKPDNPDILLSGSARMAYSLNGGATWTQAFNSHSDYHIGVWDRTNSERVWIGNDGGIHDYTTLTFGNFADSKNNDYRVTQFYSGFYFPNTEDIMGGTQDNGTLASRSYQSSFTRINGSDGGFCAVSQQNENLSYVSTQNGGIRKATNSMNTFPAYSSALNQMDADFNGSVDDGAWFINPFEINLTDGNQVYFPTLRRLWRTTNAASFWEPITNDISSGSDNPYFAAASRESNPTVYIGGERGMFYRVTDAASQTAGNETNLSGTLPSSITSDFISCLEVHPRNPEKLYATFSTINANPRVWKVTNAKTGPPSWTSISGDLPAELSVNWITCHPYAPDSILLIGTDFGLFVSTDAGNHWERETSIPAVVVTQVRIRERDQKCFVFTHGRGAYVAELPILTSAIPPITTEEIKLFPNPATEYALLQSPVEAQMEVLDQTGKVIQKGNIGANTSHTLYRHNLPSGTYFIRLRTANSQSTLRLVWQ